MTEVIDAANRGMPVLGICNGFQILCESHLLPGALIRNDHRKFICRDQRLRIENNRTPWTSAYAENAEVTIALKNGEGGFVADEETLDRLEGEGRVVFRYLDGNPNGSLRDIAGITNERGNVVGLMPHPEHAVEDLTGPGTDGLGFFTSLARRGVVRSPLLLFRRVAIAEAMTWALLLTGMFLKYVTETTELAVRVFGMAHGVVFIAYCLATLVGVDQRWSRGRVLLGLISAVPPFPTVWFDRYAERRGLRRPAAHDRRPGAPARAAGSRCCATRCVAPWSASCPWPCSPASRWSCRPARRPTRHFLIL